MTILRRAVLFDQGSKLAHTCAASNTRCFSFERGELDAQGFHVAMRNIGAGELLTTSYTPPMAALASKPVRRRLLRDKFGFDCNCGRCTLPADDARDLPCPRCWPRDDSGMLPAEAVWRGELSAESTGVLSFTERGVDGLPWACSTCGAQLPDDDQTLFGDATCLSVRGRLEEWHEASVAVRLTACGSGNVVEAFAAFLIQNFEAEVAGFDATSATSLVKVVGNLVGCDHYAFNRALLLHSEVMLAELREAASSEIFQMPDPRAGEELLDRMTALLDEVEDDWQRAWDWMCKRQTLMQHDPGYAVHEVRRLQGMVPWRREQGSSPLS